jgi:hypothetical protein
MIAADPPSSNRAIANLTATYADLVDHGDVRRGLHPARGRHVHSRRRDGEPRRRYREAARRQRDHLPGRHATDQAPTTNLATEVDEQAGTPIARRTSRRCRSCPTCLCSHRQRRTTTTSNARTDNRASPRGGSNRSCRQRRPPPESPCRRLIRPSGHASSDRPTHPLSCQDEPLGANRAFPATRADIGCLAAAGRPVRGARCYRARVSVASISEVSR